MIKKNYNNFINKINIGVKLEPNKYLIIYMINKLFGKKEIFYSFINKYYNILMINLLKNNYNIYYNYFLINLSHFLIFLPFNFQLKIKLWIYIIYYKYIIYIHNYVYNIYLCTKRNLKKFPLISLILKFINLNRNNKLNKLKINKYSKNFIYKILIIYDINKSLHNNYQSLIISKNLLFNNNKYFKILLLLNNKFLKYYYLTFNKFFNIKYLLKAYNTIALLNYYYINDINSKLYITNLHTFYIQLKLHYYNINFFIFNLKLQKKINIINLIKNNCIFLKNINNKNKIIKVFIWYQIKTLIILNYFRKTFYKITKINYNKGKFIKNINSILKFYNLIFCPLNINLNSNYLNYLNNINLNNIIKSNNIINITNIINNILVDKLININYKLNSYYLKNIFLLYNKNIFFNNKKINFNNNLDILYKQNNYNLLLNNNIFKKMYLLTKNKYIWFFEKNFIINIFIKFTNYIYLIYLINKILN